jgi:hypothetical protein
MAKVNLEDNYMWETLGTGVPGGVISSGSYIMSHDGKLWSSSGFAGTPAAVKEKIPVVTGRLKKIKWKQN